MGNAQQCMKTDPLLAAFDLADVDRMQIDLFRQFFLLNPARSRYFRIASPRIPRCGLGRGTAV